MYITLCVHIFATATVIEIHHANGQLCNGARRWQGVSLCVCMCGNYCDTIYSNEYMYMYIVYVLYFLLISIARNNVVLLGFN